MLWSRRNIRLSPDRRRIGVAIVLVLGGGCLLGSLFTEWYVVRGTSTGGCTEVVETLTPLGGVVVHGSGTDCPTSESGSFAEAGLPATGLLYVALAGLATVAGGLTFVLAQTVLSTKGRVISKAFVVISIAAIATGAIGPLLVVSVQPLAICHDQGFFSPPLGASVVGNSSASGTNSPIGANPGPTCNGWGFWRGTGDSWIWSGASGPWNSFVGADGGGGSTFSWNPGIGWGLDVFGVWLGIVGAYLGRRYLAFPPADFPPATK